MSSGATENKLTMSLFLRLFIFWIFASSHFISGEAKLLKVKKLKPDALLPRKSIKRSAGYDLHSGEDVNLMAKKKSVVNTGIALELPQNTYGKIMSRSGLAFHKGVVCFHGIIDEGYTSEIKLLMSNESDIDFLIKKGDRVAQIIVQSYEADVTIKEVKELEGNHERGEKGLGSSGIRPLDE